MWAEAGALALLGLAGGLHCFGMCGGFALAVSATAGRRGLERTLLYVLGKALTYAVLGVLAADASRWIGAGLGADMSVVRRILAWISGLSLVLVGLAWTTRRAAPRIGWLPARWRGALAATFGHLVRSARALPGRSGALATGLATGLLPCGLSWTALLWSARLDPLPAASGMFAFGMATAPALLVAAFGWRALPGTLRRRAEPVAGVACVALGVLTFARGGLPATMAAVDPRPACCREEGGHEALPGGVHAPIDGTTSAPAEPRAR